MKKRDKILNIFLILGIVVVVVVKVTESCRSGTTEKESKNFVLFKSLQILTLYILCIFVYFVQHLICSQGRSFYAPHVHQLRHAIFERFLTPPFPIVTRFITKAIVFLPQNP